MLRSTYGHLEGSVADGSVAATDLYRARRLCMGVLQRRC